jgi:hypothetical protein
MQSMKQILSGVSGAKGAARADEGGNVVDHAGDGDPDVLCAVAAMCNARLEAISELLGAGPMQSWSVVTENMGVFVHSAPGGFVAASGDATRSPEAVLKALTRQCESN